MTCSAGQGKRHKSPGPGSTTHHSLDIENCHWAPCSACPTGSKPFCRNEGVRLGWLRDTALTEGSWCSCSRTKCPPVPRQTKHAPGTPLHSCCGSLGSKPPQAAMVSRAVATAGCSCAFTSALPYCHAAAMQGYSCHGLAAKRFWGRVLAGFGHLQLRYNPIMLLGLIKGLRPFLSHILDNSPKVLYSPASS